MFGRTVRRAVLCLALAAAGIGLLWAITEYRERRTPLIDLSDREQVTTPIRLSVNGENHLRFAVATMVSAEATFATYRRLVERICADSGRQDAFILRPSYAEVRRDLEEGKVDVAFVCTGTYVHSIRGKGIKLLAQPEFENGLQYRSVFIVPTKSKRETLADLRRTVMDFTDPESNTGCLVPTVTLLREGYDPKAFFKKVVFTKSHDRSIQAVALGAVDVASVDSLVWESNLRHDPTLADKVKVIWESQTFGPPPIVVRQGLDEKFEKALQQAFLSLDEDEEGREILSSIGIKQFVLPRQEDYEGAINLYKELQERGGMQWP